ncbi:HAD family hydrolase [Paenibacillus sp. F411]|uniref:HAD family hydrolase n=1 Tax=unclassified Paenibacillus TaxID=185978 RepID=UPI001AAED6FB|nr:HAD family hydrolase [Paenibacillus sp. F411]MBO2944647.1 HAD family hydrolase [Paenibacillus sp. F411]
MTEAVQAVFFDVDDTLYDHLTPFQEAVREVVRPEAGFPYEEAYHLLRYYSDKLSVELGGAGSADYSRGLKRLRTERFQKTLEHFGIPVGKRDAEELQAAYLARQYHIEMFAGARELLRQLVNAGYTVGVITNGPLQHQMNKVAAMRLAEVLPPESIFVSGGVGWDKPDPRIFQHVNEVTGTLPGSSLFVGDSWRNDVVGALEAGWQTIWFNHRNAKPESQHLPHYTASSFEEVERILSRLLP